jgi:dihydropteroate synthase-like protein
MHRHFVTGRLAEHALREVVAGLAARQGFEYSIGVMPITVAALMTPQWLLRHWQVPSIASEIILPGYCAEGLETLQAVTAVPIRIGPHDLRDLPAFFGEKARSVEIGPHNIEIVAELNHAWKLSEEELRTQSRQLRADGADIIDLGCTPGRPWSDVGDAVRRLRDEGLRVSIDTLDPAEAAMACRAGAELVLSVNQSNREAACDWGVEVVAIPDLPQDLESLDRTIEWLAQRQVPLRIDPILEPIGLGFWNSLERYAITRRRYPDAKMLMGIGNLTELTDVDSAGVNLLLLGICQELQIQSVLTTQVINWARSSVRECDIARRLVHFAVEHRVPPKRLNDQLVLLRDPRLLEYPPEVLDRLAAEIRDQNFRIFAQQGEIHVVSAQLHVHGTDPFQVFEQLTNQVGEGLIDPGHAFYLGYELSKAVTALTLGKHYEQDEALRWGHLTRRERHHRLRRAKRRQNPAEPDPR